MRHYEILANASIPWFENLDDCPPNTMTHFPKTAIKEAMAALTRTTELDLLFFHKYATQLLAYTRKHLTTKAMATYVLEQSGHTHARSILYLSQDIQPDYLRCLLLHGFKELLGAACHDFPRIHHLYTDYPANKVLKLYGKGFTYTRLVDAATHRRTMADFTIKRDIAAHKYDIVIYGSIHRGMPYWNLVHKHYTSKDVILFCGEDLHQCVFKTLGSDHDLFIREL
jgi:hypothetical protein